MTSIKKSMLLLCLSVIHASNVHAQYIASKTNSPSYSSMQVHELLFEAIKQGNIEQTNIALQHGASPLDKDTQGCTALHWAVFYGYNHIVERLLEWEILQHIEQRGHMPGSALILAKAEKPVMLTIMRSDYFNLQPSNVHDGKFDPTRISATFNHEGSHILTANCWGTILWNFRGNKLDSQCPFTRIHPTANKNEIERLLINSAVLSPDGNHILVATNNKVELRTLKGEVAATMHVQNNKNQSWGAETAQFIPSGNHILSIKKPEQVPSSFQQDRTLFSTESKFTNEAVLCDLSGNPLETFSLIKTGSTMSSYSFRPIVSAAFSPDEDKIVFGAFDGSYVQKRVYKGIHATMAERVAEKRDLMQGPNTLEFSPDGKGILIGEKFGKAQLWEFASNKIVTMQKHSNAFGSSAQNPIRATFNPTGDLVVSAGPCSPICLWDIQGNLLFSCDKKWVVGAIFSPCGTRILGYSRDGIIYLLDLQGNEITTISHKEYHDGKHSWATFSPSGNRILSTCRQDDGPEKNGGIALLWALGGTPLDWAIEDAICSGDLTIVQRILEHIKAHDWSNCCKRTTLHSILHAAAKVHKYNKKRYETLCSLIQFICENENEVQRSFLKSLLFEQDELGRRPKELAELYKLREIKSFLDVLAVRNLSREIKERERQQATTLLFEGVQKRSIDTIETALKNGAEINPVSLDSNYFSSFLFRYLITVDKDGYSPLYLTCMLPEVLPDSEKIVELLLANGANIEVKDKTGCTPLFKACWAKSKRIIKLLLAKGANIEAQDKHGRTPLHFACINGAPKSEKIVELLLTNGANIEARDKNGETPLYAACTMGREKVVELLLANGANKEIRDKDGKTLLEVTQAKGHSKIVDLLRSSQEVKSLTSPQSSVKPEALSSVNTQSPHSENKQSESTATVKQSGRNESTQLSGSALVAFVDYLAVIAQTNPDQVEDELKQKGLEIHLPYYDSVLYWATEKGHTKLIEVLIHALIAKGIDIDANMDGNTPLLYRAVKENKQEMVDILLKHGAQVNITARYALPYVCLAAGHDNISILLKLLSHGARINDIDGAGQTALFYCTNVDTAAFLIANGARVNVQDNKGNTPLHNAINKRLRAIAVLLVTKGAHINAVNNNNESPFFEAVRHGNIEALTLLFSEDANMHLKNKDGLTAQDWAIESERKGVIEWFKTHSRPATTAAKPEDNRFRELLESNRLYALETNVLQEATRTKIENELLPLCTNDNNQTLDPEHCKKLFTPQEINDLSSLNVIDKDQSILSRENIARIHYHLGRYYYNRSQQEIKNTAKAFTYFYAAAQQEENKRVRAAAWYHLGLIYNVLAWTESPKIAEQIRDLSDIFDTIAFITKSPKEELKDALILQKRALYCFALVINQEPTFLHNYRISGYMCDAHYYIARIRYKNRGQYHWHTNILGDQWDPKQTIKRDMDLAVEHLKQVTTSDDKKIPVQASYLLGKIYLNQGNIADALELFHNVEQHNVEQEDVDRKAQAGAWFYLCHIYYNGLGNIPIDRERALSYAQKAANQSYHRKSRGGAYYYMGRGLHEIESGDNLNLDYWIKSEKLLAHIRDGILGTIVGTMHGHLALLMNKNITVVDPDFLFEDMPATSSASHELRSALHRLFEKNRLEPRTCRIMAHYFLSALFYTGRRFVEKDYKKAWYFLGRCQQEAWNFSSTDWRQTDVIKHIKEFAAKLSLNIYLHNLFSHAELGNFDQLKAFLEKYPHDITVTNAQGYNILHIAAKSGHLDTIQFLIAEKAFDVNCAVTMDGPHKGWSPLFFACSMPCPDIVQYLISAHAKTNITDSHNNRPLDIALDADNQKVVQMLIDWELFISEERAQMDKGEVKHTTPKTKPQNEQDQDCCVCFEPIKERYVSIPCGHTQTCYACAVQLKECALCKGNIEKWVKLF